MSTDRLGKIDAHTPGIGRDQALQADTNNANRKCSGNRRLEETYMKLIVAFTSLCIGKMETALRSFLTLAFGSRLNGSYLDAMMP